MNRHCHQKSIFAAAKSSPLARFLAFLSVFGFASLAFAAINWSQYVFTLIPFSEKCKPGEKEYGPQSRSCPNNACKDEIWGLYPDLGNNGWNGCPPGTNFVVGNNGVGVETSEPVFVKDDNIGSFYWRCQDGGLLQPVGTSCPPPPGIENMCPSSSDDVDPDKVRPCYNALLDPPVPVSSIVCGVNTNGNPGSSSLTVLVNSTAVLIAKVGPDGASEKSVEWTVDNNHATLSNKNSNPVTITAKTVDKNDGKGPQGGMVNITARSLDGSNRTATCTMQAKVPVSSVSIGNCGTGTITLEARDPTFGVANLTATVSPSNATVKGVQWTSEDSSKVSVEGSTGRVTANSATATGVNIVLRSTDPDAATVALNGSVKCNVKVNAKVTSVSRIDLTNPVVEDDPPTTATATVEPWDASNKAVEWASSAPTVATIVSTGQTTASITAKNQGQTQITATSVDGRFTKTVALTVNPKQVVATKVTVSCDPKSIKVNEKSTCTLGAAPANITHFSASISSSSSGIAAPNKSSMSSTGTFTVTGYSPGKATITAKDAKAYSNKSGYDDVTVQYPIHPKLTSVCGDSYITNACSSSYQWSANQNGQSGTFQMAGCPSPTSSSSVITIYGDSKCLSTSGTVGVQTKITDTSEGQYCWCRLKKSQNSTDTGEWVFVKDLGTKAACKSGTSCVSPCATHASSIGTSDGVDRLKFHAAICGPDKATYPIHKNLDGNKSVCGSQNPDYITGKYTSSAPYVDHKHANACDRWGGWDCVKCYVVDDCKVYAMCQMCADSSLKTCGNWEEMAELGSIGGLFKGIATLGVGLVLSIYDSVKTFPEAAEVTCENIIKNCGNSAECTASRALLCAP